jgi:DNA-binding CsgD family transcriptional regulator
VEILLLDAQSRVLWQSDQQSPLGNLIGKTFWDWVSNAADVVSRFSLALVKAEKLSATLATEPGTYRAVIHPCDPGNDRRHPSTVAAVAVVHRIPAELDTLTLRERDVLFLLPQDLSTKEVGVKLGLAYSTVETHIRHLRLKLRCRGVGGLVRFALRANPIEGMHAPEPLSPEPKSNGHVAHALPSLSSEGAQ